MNHAKNYLSPADPTSKPKKQVKFLPPTQNKTVSAKVGNSYFEKFEYESSPSLIDDLIVAPPSPMALKSSNQNKKYQDLILKNVIKKDPKFVPRQTITKISVKPSHRAVIVDWFLKVAAQIDFLPETIYGAISIFDRVIAKVEMDKPVFQLYAATCLWISAKVEETMTPSVDDFVYLCTNLYQKYEFIECEKNILTVLEFELTTATPALYLQQLLKNRDHIPCLRAYTTFFLNAFTMHASYSTFLPSVSAVSAVLLACVALENDAPLEIDEIHVSISSCIKCCDIMIEQAKESLNKEESIIVAKLLDDLEECQLDIADLDEVQSTVTDSFITDFCSN